MSDPQPYCCAETPGSDVCIKNHIESGKLFSDLKRRGVKMPPRWHFCPWCGERLPGNPQEN